MDLLDTSVLEYDEVIPQLLFPTPAAGYPKFQLLKADISLAEPTSYFQNQAGEADLSAQEVVLLVNTYIQESESLYNLKRRPPARLFA